MKREHKWREVGQRLQKARAAAGFTQPRVAELVGVTSTMVSLWERGRSMPRADRLQSLARLFEVRVNYLLGQDEEGYIDASPEQTGQVKEIRAVYDATSSVKVVEEIKRDLVIAGEHLPSGELRCIRDMVRLMIQHARRERQGDEDQT